MDEVPLNLLKAGLGKTTLPKLKRMSTRQKILHTKKSEYSRSFAIHGLSRVFHGTRIEKLFWLLNLILSFGVSALLIRSQVRSYFNKDTYIEEKRISTPKQEFPTITLCSRDLSTKYRYCQLDAGILLIAHGNSPPCQNKPDSRHNKVSISYPPGLLKFSVPTFEIKCGANCNFFEDIYSWHGVPNNTNCVQFNGSRIDLSTDRIGFKIKLAKNIKRRDFNVYVHHDQDTPYIINHGYFEVSSLQNTNIRIKTIKTKRLEDPFPSKCVTQVGEHLINIFPGRYSVHACSETLKCIKTFQMCGDTFDFCRRYIPQNIRLQYQNQNITILEGHACLRKHIKLNMIGQCRQPCDQIEHDVQILPRPIWKEYPHHGFDLNFVLTEPGSFIQREEKEMFSWTDLLGLVGGTIGLFCGFSFLSLFELLIYLAIRIMTKPDLESELSEKSNEESF